MPSLLPWAVLAVVAGEVVVWQKSVSFPPTLTPIPTPSATIKLSPTLPAITPRMSEVGSEAYCHQFQHDNCPPECEVGPSCPICQDEGCHAKGAHRIQAAPTSYTTKTQPPAERPEVAQKCTRPYDSNGPTFQIEYGELVRLQITEGGGSLVVIKSPYAAGLQSVNVTAEVAEKLKNTPTGTQITLFGYVRSSLSGANPTYSCVEF